MIIRNLGVRNVTNSLKLMAGTLFLIKKCCLVASNTIVLKLHREKARNGKFLLDIG